MRRNCKDRATNISVLVIRPENVLRSFDLLPVRLGIADAPDLGLRNHQFHRRARLPFVCVRLKREWAQFKRGFGNHLWCEFFY
jgi:hypothetical protein